MDDASWAALALSLTVLGGIWTWFSFQRRGLAAGLRGLAFTLLPIAAYLTKTLRLFTEILDAITDWAARLAFSPTVWLGVLVAGVSVLLFLVSGWLGRRGTDAPAKPVATRPAGGAAPDVDPELAEIEALLRKRGIS